MTAYDMMNSGFLSLDEFSFQIYPNPAHSMVTVDLDALDATEIRIFDMAGKLQYEAVSASARSLAIPLESWATGIYTVQVSTASGIRHLKLSVN